MLFRSPGSCTGLTEYGEGYPEPFLAAGTCHDLPVDHPVEKTSSLAESGSLEMPCRSSKRLLPLAFSDFWGLSFCIWLWGSFWNLP